MTHPLKRPERLTTDDGALVFLLPLPMDRANTYQHYMARHRERKALWRVLDQRVTLKFLPRAPLRPYVKAHATIELRTWRQMDEDNADARLKDVLDWFKSRGYIVDDSPEHLTRALRATTAPRHEIGITVLLREVAA